MQECIAEVTGGESGQLYSLINLFSGGGALLQLSIFAVGVMPYITASIIVQLLTVVIPRFEQLRKEGGQAGQAKMTQYTRYLAIALAILQSTSIVALAANGGLLQGCSLEIIQGQDAAEHLHPGRDGARDDRRRGAGDVDGRAGHRARHRQRHVADHLRQHRLGDAR